MKNNDLIVRQDVIKILDATADALYNDFLTNKECASKIHLAYKTIVDLERAIERIPRATKPSPLTPCDPSLMNKSVEEFLKIVDDASCFGIEVVIHNGKPYYRESTHC